MSLPLDYEGAGRCRRVRLWAAVLGTMTDSAAAKPVRTAGARR